MSKVLKTVGAIASIAAMIPGPHQPFAAAIGAAASIGAQLTAKPPAARGQVNDLRIGANNPQLYMIGRSYSAGQQFHDVGYGGEVDDVKNPYRFIVQGYSCCGPVDGLEATLVDFVPATFSGTAATGYYADYLWRDYQLGERPEADALAAQWGGTPGWSSGHKLSSWAAIGWSFKWSKKGKRFDGGRLPVFGGVWRGVKVYDARLDSTYPGGSGSCRLGDESTYVYQRNPANHSFTYAYGRYVNGVKVFGVDLGDDAIRLDQTVAWANVCDANGWNVDGTIEEPADKWNNLKRIAEAGAGQPVLAGGLLGFDFQAPRTALAEVGIDDLADGAVRGRNGRGYRERINTLVPRFRSEDHQWTYQQAAEVSEAAFVSADGEVKSDERQWDLVTDVDQVTELAIYDLWQRRAAGPFVLPCKPHMRIYQPGDCLTLLAELGVAPPAMGDVKAVLRRKVRDPMTGIYVLEFEHEDDGKHVAALGAAGAVSAAQALPTSEDLDGVSGANGSQPTLEVADEAALVDLGERPGQVVKRLDTGESWQHNGGTSGTIADWTLIGTTLLTGDLEAIEALTGTGLAARTAGDTWALRTLTAPAAGLTIANPAGVVGNPTFALANDLAGVEGLSSNGLAVRTASDTWSVRTIAGTANQVTLTNGDGGSGNPTVSLPSAITAPGSLTVSTTLAVNGNATLGDATSDAHTINGGVSNLVAANVRTVTKLASSSLSDFSTAGAALTFSRSNGSNDLAAIYAYTLTGGTLVNLALAARGDVVFATGSGSTYDAAVEAMRLTSGGALQMGGANTVVTAARLFQLRSYTVATLPAVGDALLAYASDGRKVGEGAGAGTGVPVYRDGGTWFRYGDDTAVAA